MTFAVLLAAHDRMWPISRSLVLELVTGMMRQVSSANGTCLHYLLTLPRTGFVDKRRSHSQHILQTAKTARFQHSFSMHSINNYQTKSEPQQPDYLLFFLCFIVFCLCNFFFCCQKSSTLFQRIMHNAYHVLYHLLPERRELVYNIRPRYHDRQLSIISGQLRKRNFIYRMLFKDSY